MLDRAPPANPQGSKPGVLPGARHGWTALKLCAAYHAAFIVSKFGSIIVGFLLLLWSLGHSSPRKLPVFGLGAAFSAGKPGLTGTPVSLHWEQPIVHPCENHMLPPRVPMPSLAFREMGSSIMPCPCAPPQNRAMTRRADRSIVIYVGASQFLLGTVVRSSTSARNGGWVFTADQALLSFFLTCQKKVTKMLSIICQTCTSKELEQLKILMNH